MILQYNTVTTKKIKEKAKQYSQILENKLAYDVIILDVSKLTPFEDIFIIATARNARHLSALSKELTKQIDSKCVIEGLEELQTDNENLWVLIDNKDIVVNLCTEDGRKHFNLDSLWIDAKQIDNT